MKKTLFTAMFLTGLYIGVFAQRQPDNVSKFDSKIQSITLDNLTGNIIVKEANKVSAFNPVSNLVEWTVTDETNFLVKVNKATGAEVDKIAIDNTKPIYEIDFVTDNLYYVNNNELRIFSKK